MLRAILNKSWRQLPSRHQLYGHLPPTTKTIQVRHAGHCWKSRDDLISDVLLWTPTYGRAKAGQPARTYLNSYVRIRDVALKTYQRRCMIGRSGERGSGISVLVARHDDDDVDISILITILLNDKDRSPVTKMALQNLTLTWEMRLRPHPTYSSDLLPNDFHFFNHLTPFLRPKTFC